MSITLYTCSLSESICRTRGGRHRQLCLARKVGLCAAKMEGMGELKWAYSLCSVIEKNVRVIGNPGKQDSFFLRIVLEWSQKF